MSIQSSLDFQLVYGEGQTVIDLFECLINNGWNYSCNGKITYLPVGDHGDYDWQCHQMSVNQLREIMKEKLLHNEVIGITMTWENTEIGGDFLFWPDGNLSLIVNKNRKILINQFTDVSWYISRILPVFNTGNIQLVGYTFEEN